MRMQWHTPIGYKVINGKITVYEEHSKIVEQIFKDYDSGISALHIAKSLKKMGIKNAKGSVSWMLFGKLTDAPSVRLF